jgi:hypothetical protein
VLLETGAVPGTHRSQLDRSHIAFLDIPPT